MTLLEMHQFTKDYYEDGIRKHISGYENYSWMPTRSIPEALDIQQNFEFKTCVDYGCAKGFLVHALRIIGCDAYGEDPKLYRKGEPVVKGEKVKVLEPEFGHQRQWVDACKAGFNSAEHKSLTSSFDYSGPLTETVLMGNIAIRSYMLTEATGNRRRSNYIGRKKLLWDGENMKINNLEAANQYVGRTYRKGWEL